MSKHLAIFSKDVIEEIFAGRKNIESRFSQKKIAPFGVIERGDIVYIKPPGREVVGQFKVAKVIFIDGLSKDEWELIKQKYGKNLSLGSKKKDQRYFDKHLNAKYATLIFMDEVEKFITSPVRIKKKDLRGWMVL
ncbi:hypothetical protein HYS91_02680 [Candidatus Daviesbacteria bacterium]|nr:hypothetical protein [Candidatus Daviesbacteria bacterium]